MPPVAAGELTNRIKIEIHVTRGERDLGAGSLSGSATSLKLLAASTRLRKLGQERALRRSRSMEVSGGPLEAHEIGSEVALYQESIVSSTTQSQIVCSGFATSGVRRDVMQLEEAAFATAFASRAYERALAGVSAVNFADNRARDVA